MGIKEDPGCVIHVRVLPRASRNRILAGEDGALRIKLTAPAVENKANVALIRLLARHLGIARGRVEIISGGRSRRKSVRIQGLAEEDVRKRLLPSGE